jgi:hypothetical protein
LYSKSFFPYAIKLWNSIPDDIRSANSLSTFKSKLNPPKSPMTIYYYGKRWANVHHARLRMKYSALNDDLCNRLHVINDSSCKCGFNIEDANHFIRDCPLYDKQRKLLEKELCNLKIEMKDGKLDTELLLNGDPTLSDAFNIKIFKLFHNYITNTNRFS